MAQFKRPTTTDLITNGKYSNAATGTIIETLGYTTKGDGGGAQWKKTGNTITASQTPSQTGSGTCSDASGNEFEIVIDGQVNALALGALYDDATDDSAAHNAGLAYLNSKGGGNLILGEGITRANIVNTFDKVGIVGLGRSSIIAPASGIGVSLSGITGGFGGYIHNFAVSGVNGAADGVYVNGFSRGKIGTLWLIDGLTRGMDIDGDGSTEFTNQEIYINNATGHGIRYLRTDGVDTGGIYFDTLHVTGSTQTAIGIECTSTHTSRTRAFMFVNKLVIDNRATEAVLLKNVESFFISQMWATGTIASKGMLTLQDVKDCFIQQAWLQNSDASGYNLLISGGGASPETADLMLNQLRTSGPGTSVQFNGSPTLTRCHIGQWDDTASTNTNDAARLAQMRNEALEGSLTVDGVVNVGGSVSTLTISSGVVTATSSFHRIAPESGTADTLDTINGGVQGDRLLIMGNSSANTITVGHGTGNIYLDGAANKTLDSSRDKLELVFFGSEWQQIGFSNNS